MSKIQTKSQELIKSPEVKAKIRFWRHQWIGLPLLFTLPILALFGAFGKTMETVQEFSSEVELTVEYPAKFRHGQQGEIKIGFRNNTPHALENVKVSFDPQYIEKFSDLSFLPAPRTAYSVAVEHLPPGATQEVLVNIQADKYGKHSGSVAVINGNRTLAEASLTTRVFP